MKVWSVIPAMPEHIPAIAANMREADKREVWASDRHEPLEALTRSLELSPLAWTCTLRDEPAFMWGVARRGCLLDGTGIPWLLGTDAIQTVSLEFLRQCRAYVDRMQEGYARLENFVHADNALSIRWLRWCGFTIGEEPVEKNGEAFFPFWREV